MAEKMKKNLLKLDSVRAAYEQGTYVILGPCLGRLS